MFSKIKNRLFHLLSVPRCVCCDERLEFKENCLCDKCLSQYQESKLRNCSRCAKILSECTCTSDYLNKHYVRDLVKIYRYNYLHNTSAENRIIYSLKQNNRADVFDFLSDELAHAFINSFDIKGKEDSYIITNVPRRSKAIREYGYDHSAALAKRIGKILGIKYKRLLKSKAKKPQKGMHGEERRRNAVFAYRRGAKSLKGYTVFLIDDIVTTGSSMGNCATLIRGLGARKIIGGAVAIAYKDMYTPPLKSYYK